MEAPPPTLEAPAAPDPAARPEAPLEILFVDDEPDLQPLMRQRFRRHTREGRYTLDFAGDGVEALEKLDADPEIEIVVTDLNMPRMDGLTLLGHLRERERLHKAIVVTAYGDMENIRTAMNQGAFDFLTKPIDPDDLEATISNARAIVERDREAALVRDLFSVYVSKEVAEAILRNPKFTLGQRRNVSVLMSDLTGFSALAERLEPERVVELLNVYLGRMTDVVGRYGGTVDEFIGDAVLAIFGAPIEWPDHAARAVACAVAMQREMEAVNEEMRQLGLPHLEAGIGVNTGEVVVGRIGGERRAKYGVVGSPVNLTSRIQTLAAGGEVVISDDTRRSAGDVVRVRESRAVAMKGFADPIPMHFVGGVGGEYALDVPDAASEPLVALPDPIPLVYTVLDGKRVDGEQLRGSLTEVSATRAIVLATQPVEPRSDLKLTLSLPPVGGAPPVSGDLYGKVLAVGPSGGGASTLTLRLTAVPDALAAALGALRNGAPPAAAPPREPGGAAPAF